MIEAWQWNGIDGVLKTDPDWVAECTEPTSSPFALAVVTHGLIVHTARGQQRAKPRDWIVRIQEKEVYVFSEEAWELLRLPAHELRYLKAYARMKGDGS